MHGYATILVEMSLSCLIVLDEATCALSEESEEHFYKSLKEMGITVLSVGHRTSLKKVGRRTK